MRTLLKYFLPPLAPVIPLFVFVVWVFLPALNGKFMVFDEQSYVNGNVHVNSGLSWGNIFWAFRSLDYANWHPLTWISHMLDVQLYGLNPLWHHLTSVLIHAFNTVLVFLVFRRMTGAGWRSLMVAGLFGLHPLRVESVAWISERKDVLSTMFWLLAMWTYVKFAEEFKAKNGKAKLFYGLTLLFFAMGLMSKTMLVTLPFVFLLLDYWPLKRWEQKNKWDLVLEKIPFFLMTIIVSIIAYIAQQKAGAMKETGGLPFSDHVENALLSYVRYLGMFVWPENLCIYYPYPESWPVAKVLAAGLFLIFASWLVWTQRRRRPYLLVGWLWYLGTLVPVIGLVQLQSQSMADRYTYVPLIGVYVLLVWGLWEAAERWRHGAMVLSVMGAAAMIICVALTRYEIGFWRDDITVWNRAIAVTKNNYVAHTNLGGVLPATQFDAKFAQFQEAVRENPDFADAQRKLADELVRRVRPDEAIIHYQKALAIDPDNAETHYNLGIAFIRKGQIDEAIIHYQMALKIDPNNAEAHNNLGTAFIRKGQIDEAIVQYQRALTINPNYAEAHNNLGNIFLQKERVDEAIIHYQRALAINPNYVEAHYNLGSAFYRKGRVVEAIASTQQALQLAISQNNATLAATIREQLKFYAANSRNDSTK